MPNEHNPTIERIEISALKPAVCNARTHSKRQIKQIADSIRRFGFTNPLLIDDDNRIVAGHGRLDAARLMDISAVPCLRLSHMTGADKRAYIIADNKIALNAGWDLETLVGELEGLTQLGFDVELTGFLLPEVDILLHEAAQARLDPVGPADECPDITSNPVTRLGDRWTLGRHVLVCGDAKESAFIELLMAGCVRDKIAASKRKGIWVGGPVPLGYASVNKKLVIVPDEAETVREIFRRYLELGSVRLLAADLDKSGIKSKIRDLSGGRTSGGGRFGLGALSHFLKNRFYIGEIAYRGEIHLGEHEPILDRAVFEEVQAKLLKNNLERRLKLKSSLSLLAGRIYDDRANRMLPSHTVKNGVRYRYYVSSAIQQKRDGDVGSVSRVPAPEIEDLVVKTIREFCDESIGSAQSNQDKCLARLQRVVIAPTGIKLHIADLESSVAPEADAGDGRSSNASDREPAIVSVPWEPEKFIAVKGVILDLQDSAPALKPESREAILTAIAKARQWIDDLTQDKASIAGIAKREGKIERHIRLLLPLAFVSPAMVNAIANGSAPTPLTVTGLAKRVPLSWN